MPGSSISEVGRVTGTKWGALQHHLRLLERAGLVRSRRDGRELRLFPPDVDEKQLEAIALLRRHRMLDLVRAITQDPGVIQRDITSRTNLSRKTLRRYVDLLAKESLVVEVRERKCRRYFPTQRLLLMLDQVIDERALEATPIDRDGSDPTGGGKGPME